MKYKTIDTIVRPHQTLKADYYYIKVPSAPKPIEPIYQKLYQALTTIYDNSKYITEWVYNIILRK